MSHLASFKDNKFKYLRVIWDSLCLKGKFLKLLPCHLRIRSNYKGSLLRGVHVSLKVSRCLCMIRECLKGCRNIKV